MNIAEVSKKFGISPDTLRYYERIGLLPYVKRNESGYREYDDEACEWIYFTLVMRSAGISVEALKTYISLFQQGKSTYSNMRINCSKIEAKMKMMQAYHKHFMTEGANIPGYMTQIG